MLNRQSVVFSCYRADPLSNIHVDFSSKEDAMAFCDKNGKILIMILVFEKFVALSLEKLIYVNIKRYHNEQLHTVTVFRWWLYKSSVPY